MEKINHELNEYDFAEGIEFEGLVPATMDVLGEEKVIGGGESVPYFGFNAKGSDPLQVIDEQAMYDE